ncbi:MAG: polyprenyl synthetase family protein [Bdellovibrionota bacterium]
MNLERQQQEFILLFDAWLKAYLEESKKNKNFSKVLLESQQYSLQSGGKRFRPFLASLIYGLFTSDLKSLKNFCLSIEMIHTYSLIHDDLPCMDNDDLRRGKPTNHKVFSEDISLLAGDGLLSDVFLLLSSDENINLHSKVELIRLVSEKIGSTGMVSGQVFDMKADRDINLEELSKIHALKTANLIQASAMGAGIVAGCTVDELHNISEFSYHLGMAFQIKDDLLDFKDKDQDFKSYPQLLGLEKTKEELDRHSKLAKNHLLNLGKNNINTLIELVDFNLLRDF